MEIDAEDSNSGVEVKSVDVEYEKVERTFTIKEEKYEVSNTGIARNDIRIKLDLSDDDDLLNSKTRNYKCEICNKLFKSKSILSRHAVTHTEERSYKCEMCNKCFTTKGNLFQHVKTHTKERNYKCEMCNKCFTTKGNLFQHVKTHTKERNYKCEMCNKCFTTKELLSRHIKSHTEERNYKCEICSKCFTTESILSRHAASHSRKVLLEHMNIDTEEIKNERTLRSFPCIVSTSTTEFNDIDKHIVKKEIDAFLDKDNLENNFDATEKKPSTAANENLSISST